MDKFIELKMHLMTEGVKLDISAKKFLIKNYGEKFYNDDYVTTTGIMVELLAGFVTVHLNDLSSYEIFYDNGLYLKIYNEIMQINIWEPADFMINRVENKNGLISNFVNVHFDRARINPISGCNNSCKFCSMNEISYRRNSIEEIDLALNEALKDKRVTHVLISGGSPKEVDLPYVTKVYEYFCKKYPKYDFDVMMTPREFDSYQDVSQYEKYLKYLKTIGVKGLSINLELFNDKMANEYCKEKSIIGKESYFTFLKLASKVFGKYNVRSGLIVGLEPKEDTLKGVEQICKCGCMPMLSPYVPYNGIGKYPTADFLIDIYKETEKILKKYNLPLAPLCEKCKHNTL